MEFKTTKPTLKIVMASSLVAVAIGYLREVDEEIGEDELLAPILAPVASAIASAQRLEAEIGQARDVACEVSAREIAAEASRGLSLVPPDGPS